MDVNEILSGFMNRDGSQIPRREQIVVPVDLSWEPRGNGPLISGEKWVYPFKEGRSYLRDLLGRKGAELAEMTNMGLPVPPGFTITSEACLEYVRGRKTLPPGLWEQVLSEIVDLEIQTRRSFGDPKASLLVAVRSGSAVSMPGMMDTILNLGMNWNVVDGISSVTGDRLFALDLYRRMVEMYANVVLGVDNEKLAKEVGQRKYRVGVYDDSEPTVSDVERTIERMLRVVEREAGTGIPDDPYLQLQCAIKAVFNSWNTRRAIAYREYHGIQHDLGTAANVVAMVFGNMDANSSTGVLLSRNPSTGERELYGEYLMNAQGEDLVSGIRTPLPLSDLRRDSVDLYRKLEEIAERLEGHYKDAQDIEFTVEQGNLYLLQTRPAKRTARAGIKMAVDMVSEGLINKKTALLRVDPDQISQLLLPRLTEEALQQARTEGRGLAMGVGASPGGVSGAVVFSADSVVEKSREKRPVILVRPTTSAEDVHGILAASGILTSRGGATSHAAVVARGLGKPCVTGAESIEVNPDEGLMRVGGVTVGEGEIISIDGATGEVLLGHVETIQTDVVDESELLTLIEWTDDFKRLGVWTNADTVQDARLSVEFGAAGIGLCRTERMFFDPDRLSLVREMILEAHASSKNGNTSESHNRYISALAELEKIQTTDFEDIFEVMAGRPVVIRLLDPPLHEFLPAYPELLKEVTILKSIGETGKVLSEKEMLLTALSELNEVNPMLGPRGCRLGLMYPAIYEMQARAIVTAAARLDSKNLIVKPQIMVPLVASGREMHEVRLLLENAIQNCNEVNQWHIECKIGAMIELPRAALVANDIAENAEFFSFGTNDLTQATFGVSRDDAEGKFLAKYLDMRILDQDPFKVIDRGGVGRLVETGIMLGRATREDITVGICGEHGGDPSSIQFFHDSGIDYVSCSPFRIPVARLAAAQAALRSLD